MDPAILQISLHAGLRDLVYLAIALTAYGVGLHFLISLLGFRYAQTMDKLDNNAVAISIFLGALALSLALLVGTILHG